jgi:hypothetical protein
MYSLIKASILPADGVDRRGNLLAAAIGIPLNQVLNEMGDAVFALRLIAGAFFSQTPGDGVRHPLMGS